MKNKLSGMLSRSYFIIKLTFIITCIMNLYSCNELPNHKDSQGEKAPEGMVWIEGADFEMGLNSMDASRSESPKHKVSVSGFFIDQYEVTNRQFKEFVRSTNYVTTAEKTPTWEEIKHQFPEGSEPLPDSVLIAGSIVYFKTKTTDLNDYTQWWQYMPGACWKHPLGPKSNIDTLLDHPVVHVSWFDAMNYAKWANKDLPTEAEWELAAGASKNQIYPWGNTIPNASKPQSNHFQGLFPEKNIMTDGYVRTSPVGVFPPNVNELYDMGGNVWEWCKDWYDIRYFEHCEKLGITINPQGPTAYFDPSDPLITKKIVKGGSFLCNDSYCSGYKISKKMQTDPYSSLDHTGFRCVVRINDK